LTRSSTLNSGTPTAGTTNFYIANRAALDRTFDGLIGQVRIDSGVLTQAQIRQLAMGQSPTTPVHDYTFDAPLDLPYLDGCRAIKCDGTDDYIAAANGIANYPFTLMGWMRSTGTGSFQGCISVHSGGTAYCYIGTNSSGYPYISARNTTEYAINGTTAITDGQWHHVAGVFASATDRKLYVDGVQVASDVNSLAFPVSTDIFIGKVRTAAPSYGTLGDIADARVFSAALTQAQIRSLISGTDFTTGLSARWKFGETPRSIPSCAGGYSLDFDGVDDYVLKPAFPAHYPAFTLCAWVKPKTLKSQGIFGDAGWIKTLYFNGSGDTLSMYVNVSSGTDAVAISTSAIRQGEWVHVAATFDDAGTRKPRLFINGVEVSYSSQVALVGTMQLLSSVTHYFGRYDTTYSNIRLDDARFYGRILSDAEIAAIAAGGDASVNETHLWPFDDGPQYGEPSNGDPIAVWEDRNGINFAQANTVNRPTFLQSGVNGRPGVTFDGVQQYLASAGWIPNDPYGTLVVATKLNAAQQGAIMGSSIQGTGTYEWEAGVYTAGQPWIYQRAADTANGVKNDSYPLGTSAAKILTFRSDGSLYDARLDGVRVPLTAYSSTNNGDWFADTPGRTNLTLGVFNASSFANYLAGTIYEILYFPTPLSDVQLRKVEKILGSKYGVTIA
jgi:hypothetical protein